MVPPAGRTADGAFWLMVAVLTAMPYDSAFAARIWPWTEPGTQVNSRTSPNKRIARRMISIFIVFSLLAISVLVRGRLVGRMELPVPAGQRTRRLRWRKLRIRAHHRIVEG